VRGQRNRATILAALKSRLANTAELERTLALAEIAKIARFRLDDLVGA
jgi:2-oxo-4-hydroxy-4-carboxy--5-ureidoimidazoline (OHCU) decarboxylase